MSKVLSTYAAYSLDLEERLASSSGGLFSLFAKSILSDGGIVYGVALSEDCQRAEFIRVQDEIELMRLRGSKYFQACVGTTFNQVKKDLCNGIKVLFSGTACQVNGLISYLGAGQDAETTKQKYLNLYCLDVICHGVPSPALWRAYVNYVEKKNQSRLVSVNFRSKDKGWGDYGVKAIDANHNVMFSSRAQNPFMQMFLRDYCLRPSCYECNVKVNKLSNLTIADFWGIESVASEMTDGNGTSLVIVRDEKGNQLVDEVRNLVKIKLVDYDDGIRGNRYEYKSVNRPLERNYFFVDMKKMEFEDLCIKYASPIKTPYHSKIKSRIKYVIKYVLVKAGLYKRGGDCPKTKLDRHS